MSEPSGAVAAILAATPKTSTGQVAQRYEVLPDLLLGVPCDAVTFGDPTLIAARQAAAAARAFAAGLIARYGIANRGVYRAVCWLRDQADEIEEAGRGGQA